MGDEDAREALRKALDGVNWGAVDSFAKQMHAESDRAAIVLGAAMLHDGMKGLLVRFLPPSPRKPKDIDEDELFGIGRPLAEYEACLLMCHRLRLVDDDEAHNLKTVQKIRNKFSHVVATPGLNEDPFRSLIANMKQVMPSKTFWKLFREHYYGGEDTPRVKLRGYITVMAYDLHGMIDLIETLPPQRKTKSLPVK